MKKTKNVLRLLYNILGFFSAAFFLYAFFVFLQLKPKMVRFEALTRQEEALITWVGIGLLVVLVFFIFSLYLIVRYVRYTSEVTLLQVLLVICCVASLLFVFADVALMSDIYKQHKAMLAQPEWALLLPIVAFQLVVTLILAYLHLSGYLERREVEEIAQDSNTFLVVHYVGLLCSAMGLAAAGLGFLFPWGWNLITHVVISSAVLLLPYGLVALYWLSSNLKEHGRILFDEKQLQDIGRSAWLALGGMIVGMMLVFSLNFNRLDGVIRMLWAPLLVFGSIFLFSLGILAFNRRA